MAGRGPAPKADRQRERDNKKRVAGSVNLTVDGTLRGEPFPKDSIPDPHAETILWWKTWRMSAQAQLFEATDWNSLRRGAYLVDLIWKNPKPSIAAMSELRLIEERFGATYVDRQRAKISISQEQPDDGADRSPKATKANIAARMNRPRE